MMMFLSKWLRRSNANTGAEWLQTRFGRSGKGIQGSHVIVIAFALIGCLGFMAYGFIGLGKFVQIFVPWNLIKGYMPFTLQPKYVPHFYGIVFTLIATLYAILGGMHSIVLGDVIKYVIMIVACLAVGVIAWQHMGGQKLLTPSGWSDPFFGWRLNLDWAKIIPDANKKIADDGYSLFGIFFMMMLLKGVFASLAGPAPNYDMQKVLSTRSPKDASKMTGFVSIILLPVRYSLVVGLTVLGLLYYHQINIKGPGGITDFERVLPATINAFLPAGIMGLVLTGLLGAFMGTFSGTLNAAQAYVVNDIYLKYINPKAGNKRVLYINYAVGCSVVIAGTFFGFIAHNVNDILQWIVGGLYGGYVAANVLKWFWWRFNANGFFWGMVVGVVAALLMPYLTTGLPLYWWPLLFVLSLAASIAGTYAAPATDMDVLVSFYKTVKPWGFWAPVHEVVLVNDPGFKANKNFRLDMFNVVLGIIAQLCLTILPMYLITRMNLQVLAVVAILIVIGVVLKRTWWDKLEN
jgi:Na+/proline symporter